MVRNMKRIALVLCLLALCAGLLSTAVFADTYEPISAVIPVEVVLSGTLPETPDTFQIQMTAVEDGNPMPEGAVDGVYTMDLTGASAGELELTFSKLGIYNYTVKQLPLGNDDCYQDMRTYTVAVYVTNNENYDGFNVSVLIFCEDQEDKLDGIIFENRYANPDYAQIVATKTMDKKAPKDGAFTFELVDAEGNVVQTVANDADGNVTFEPIYCYEIGSTTYTIREVAGADKKIIYDKTVYTVVVDVTKDDNGDYVAAVTYLKGEEPLEGAPAFANKTKPVVPKTADEATPFLWCCMMAAAAVMLSVLLRKRRMA